MNFTKISPYKVKDEKGRTIQVSDRYHAELVDKYKFYSIEADFGKTVVLYKSTFHYPVGEKENKAKTEELICAIQEGFVFMGSNVKIQ